VAKFLKRSVKAKPAADTQLQRTVESIIAKVQQGGDRAVRALSEQFDGWAPKEFQLSQDEIRAIVATVPKDNLEAITFSLEQVRNFATEQRKAISDIEIETLPGVTLGHKNIPVGNVGCYVPGGRYPMVASAIMSIVTAKVAGVKRVIACTPPSQGKPYPTTVAAMVLAGADEVYILGGVQAVAAMALGTESIEAVDMIVGPGNAYVAEAKRQLFGKVGIDLLAGPTEVLVIADETADAEMVATDLLGQAEHGPTSPATLITTSESLARATQKEIERQLQTMPTADVAGAAWHDFGQVIIVTSDEEAVAEADIIAAEHVQILTRDPQYYLDHLSNYGSLFLGPETNVAYGDKTIGTNHILPTNGAARYTGGLWVGKFLKTVTYQRCTPAASVTIGQYCAKICDIEGFFGHKAQADLRVRRYGAKRLQTADPA
jgi:sulfopropanediol 3-dehydrogenase